MEGDWETANAFYPGVDSTACLDGSEPIAIQCRVHETQMDKDEEGVLRCMIRSRGEKRPAEADGALPKAKAKKARK